MNKNFFFIMFFSVLFPVLVASQTENPIFYCQSSLAQYSENELLELGITPSMISNTAPCICWGKEPEYSQWFSDYCIGGKLQETRFVYVLRRPQCDIFERTTEKQFLVDERCAICPEPVSIGAWNYAECVEGKPLLQRQVNAYLFDTEGQCQLKNMVELQISQTQPCQILPMNVLMWVMIIVSGATASLLIIFIYKRKKR